MAKAECKKVIGSDEYGREAWLMVSQHKDSDKIEILSSEEGGPVVYSKSQVSELINGEREIPGRQKVVRGSNVQVLTLHAGLNPRSKSGYEREARVIKELKKYVK